MFVGVCGYKHRGDFRCDREVGEWVGDALWHLYAYTGVGKYY